MLTYDEVFRKALIELMGDYENGRLEINSERDIQCHIYYACMKLMRKSNFELPYRLHAEKRPFPYKTGKTADLILGSNEVVVEVKLLKRGESATTDKTKAAKADVTKKLAEYANLGVRNAYFIMVDEHGHSKRHLPGKWRTVNVGRSKAHFLILKVIKGDSDIKILTEPEMDFSRSQV